MNKKILVLFAGFLLCLAISLTATPQLTSPEQGSASSSEPAPEHAEQEIPPPSALLENGELLNPLQNDLGHESDIITPVLRGEYQEPDESLAEEILKNAGAGFTAVTETVSHNHELQVYLPEQAAFSGSHILLTADHAGDQQYVSAKAESVHAFRYGTFSFRIPVMHGTGLFPAIWMLPASGEEFPEVDIYEMVGNNPDYVYGVMHYLESGKSEKSREFFKYHFEDAVPDSYVVRLEWTADAMTWYLDDEKRMTIDHDIPDIPMYLILNLAVGGDWPGTPGAETVFPATFDVELLEFQPEEIFAR